MLCGGVFPLLAHNCPKRGLLGLVESLVEVLDQVFVAEEDVLVFLELFLKGLNELVPSIKFPLQSLRLLLKQVNAFLKAVTPLLNHELVLLDLPYFFLVLCTLVFEFIYLGVPCKNGIL